VRPVPRQAGILENLWLRARLLARARCFFEARGFLEVETPCRIPAPLPEAHIEPVGSDGWYLHASPESCMKRLLAAGAGSVFQICRVHRKGERGARHLPEFTLLEWYRPGADYQTLMDDCEALITGAARELGRGIPGVDLGLPWPRLTVREAFARYAPCSMEQSLQDGAFDRQLAFHIEPSLDPSRPLFLLDYPAEKASLARLKSADPGFAERVELYIGGLELANGFSELTDAPLQTARFTEENRAREKAGLPVAPWPGRFIEDLARMPESAGMALGLDRLAMLFCGVRTIDEVTAFVPEEL
jgi:lysyl-tRNA synthetase class 2